MTSDDLDPLTPVEARDWYLEDRIDDARWATRRKHASGIGFFVDWTDEAGIDNMNHLGGRDLYRFKTWRKNNSDLTAVSLNGTLAVVRRFLVFCEQIDAVRDDLPDDVPFPNVPHDEEISGVVPTDEEVERIRAYYQQFEYASRRHAVFELIAEVGLRVGAVRAIDLNDFDDEMQIQLYHRPENPDVKGTPLKNGTDGERYVNLPERLVEVLNDYVAHNRCEVTDRFGRQPLFTSPQGRVSTATIRRDFYKMTRPCTYAAACPHDRTVADCEATQNTNASGCPSSFSMHPLRRWSIMRQLDAGVEMHTLSDRVDVSVPVLEKHYDQRTKAQKSRQRREHLSEHLPGYADQ